MMMLRLARAGSKKRPVYHLVAADRRARRDGRHVENLGYYVPAQDVLVLNQERIEYWQGQGAQTTETAGRLIKKAKKFGNTEPTTKAKYEPPPIKPVEPKKAEEAPKAESTEAALNETPAENAQAGDDAAKTE
ncbi:MAG: 30S ribosomal protein S16 [Myxococcota bacterium]